MRTAFRIAWQCGILLVINAVGSGIVGLLHWKVSGSMVGIALLLLLLATRVIKLEQVEHGANWMLGTMLLFFIPSAVGIVQYGELLRADGWRLLVIIGCGTVLVMAATGLLAEWIIRRREGKAWQRGQHGSD